MGSLFVVNHLPFLLIYAWGIYVCREHLKKREQPALLGLMIFSGFLIRMVLILGFQYWYFGILLRQEAPVQEMVMRSFNALLLITWFLLYGMCLPAVFSWRFEQPPEIRRPRRLVIIAFVLLALTVFSEYLFHYTLGGLELYLRASFGIFLVMLNFFDIVRTLLEAAALLMILKAMFGGRDESMAVPESRKRPAVADGMFHEKEYPAFLAGVFIFAGMIFIPLVWGPVMGVDSYGKALGMSLISCGVYVYAHDKKGNFSFQKLLIGFAALFYIFIQVASKGRSGVESPVFLAGGLLGYLVMMAGGWLGIGAWRLFMERTPPGGNF